MENKKTKNIVGILAIIIVILLVVIFIMWNTLRNSDKKSKTTYEAEQLELFVGERGFGGVKETDAYKTLTNGESVDIEEAKYNIYTYLSEAKEDSAGATSDAVDSYFTGAKETILSATSIEELKGMVDSLLDIDVMGFVTGLLGGSSSEPTTSLTLGSDTVCESGFDKKFCIDNLSANVYVTDENTTNWAVVVHPFMTSGSLMYNSVGTHYAEAGYNVLAPDLRGFGNSGGSVAMGYLESLDIYDWIKDLNENPTRYGVNSAPTNIIVHGVSLGGATTLQLATNPDIAAAKGGEYAKTLTQLHVNGFVDDCGYTSMSGIITGMFSVLDISSLTSSLDSLGISLESLLTEMQGIFSSLGINDFVNLDISSYFGENGNILPGKISDVTEILNSYANVGNLFDIVAGTKEGTTEQQKEATGILANGGNIDPSKFENILGGYISTDYYNSFTDNYNKYNSYGKDNGTITDNNEDLGGWGSQWNNILSSYFKKYPNLGGGDYQNPTTPSIPTKPSDWNWNNWYSKEKTSTTEGMLPTLINDSSEGTENFLDGIISTVLINLIGVGLTEDNYSYYSDAFAEGRRFPSGSNIAIIHGTADTTVPHSNADTVAANIPSDVNLFKKWDAEGMPHAFVIIGTGKEDYGNFVKEFSSCVANNSCTKTQ